MIQLHNYIPLAQESSAVLPDGFWAIILYGNQVRTRRLGPYGTCITFALYTLDGTVCMVIRSCLWSNVRK